MSKSLATNEIDPIRHLPSDEIHLTMDNPKGKIKIRFIRNEYKTDSTNRPKGFLSKLKNVVDMIMNASENPPFKVEIVREKEKKN